VLHGRVDYSLASLLEKIGPVSQRTFQTLPIRKGLARRGRFEVESNPHALTPQTLRREKPPGSDGIGSRKRPVRLRDQEDKIKPPIFLSNSCRRAKPHSKPHMRLCPYGRARMHGLSYRAEMSACSSANRASISGLLSVGSRFLKCSAVRTTAPAFCFARSNPQNHQSAIQFRYVDEGKPEIQVTADEFEKGLG